MIKLKDETAFACGNHRQVYRHPEKPDRCLKLMTEEWVDSKRSLRAIPFAKLFRPRWYYHENEGELHFSDVLRKRVGSVAWGFIAQAYEFVESDLGNVLETDLITDYNGEISISMKEYIWKNGFTDACKEANDLFWEQLDREWVFVHGRPDNVSVRQLKDGSCQIVAIDGYTYSQLIPLSKWFRREQKRVFRKRRMTQEKRINEILKLREKGEELTKQGMILNMEDEKTSN